MKQLFIVILSGMVHLVLDEPLAHPPDQGDEDLPHHDGHRHCVTLLLNDFTDFSKNREGVTQMLLSWGLNHSSLLSG